MASSYFSESIAVSPKFSSFSTHRTRKSEKIAQLALATSPMEHLTEFPPRSVIVGTRVLLYVALHLLETFECLREATIPFQLVTNHAINEKPREFELNRKRQYSALGYQVMHTLAAAINASCADPRFNIMLAHLTSTVFGAEELSNNAAE